MRVSKHLHSCLLVEENGKTVLIDPGIFTYQEKALDVNKLEDLHYIAITHEHPDHMHLPLIKDLLAKFPNVQILSNASVVSLLQKEGIDASTNDNEFIKLKECFHEKLWDRTSPQNVLVRVFDRLIQPGDSHHFSETANVLALPIAAPWGSTTSAVELALKLKPKVIIPIHDWMLKDEILKGMYKRLEEYFASVDISFKGVETGEIIEV